MSREDTSKNGRPIWADCAVADLAAAESFYAAVFGWTSKRETDSTGSIYAVQRLDGRRVAGIYELSEEMRNLGVPPHWATYFEVGDLDESLDQVRQAGGKLLDGPMDEEGVGRMAVIQDAVGAYLRLWTPAPEQGGEVFNIPGAMIWNELCTEEPERAAAFYKDTLGLLADTIDAGGKPYTLLKAGEDPVAGILLKTPEMGDSGPTWDVYFAAADADAFAKRAQEAGGTIISAPFDLPTGGRMAVIQDPMGAVFEVMQMPEAEA